MHYTSICSVLSTEAGVQSLSLAHRIPRFAVECVQVLGLDELQPSLRQPAEQSDDLGGRAGVVAEKATPPVVGAERLRPTVRPHFHAAVGDHRQLEPSAGARLDTRAQDI